MPFPPTREILDPLVSGLVLSPLVLLVAALVWLKRRKFGDLDPMHVRNVAAIMLLIGAVHFLGAYGRLVTAIRLQTTASEVAQIQVVPVPGEGLPPSRRSPVALTNTRSIRSTLSELAHATHCDRSHEHYSDGYRIRLSLAGEDVYSNIYITAFRQSSRRGRVNVVIPHFGPDAKSTPFTFGGQYCSPEFHEWITKEIDPLFR